MPRPHRVVQEAARRSSSSTSCPAVGFAVDYDALDARFGGGGYPGAKMQPMTGPEPERPHAPVVRMGDPDRRVPAPHPARARSTPSTVWGGLEDDFHHFEVTLHHDGAHVTGIEMHAVRWPWATCPDAGAAAAGARRHGALRPLHRGRGGHRSRA